MTNLFTTVRGNRVVDHLASDGWLVLDIDHDDPPGTFWPLCPSAKTVTAARIARRCESYQCVRAVIRNAYTADLRAAYKTHRAAFDAIKNAPGAIILDAEHDDTYRQTLLDVLVRLGHRHISPLLHGTGYEQPVVIWLDLETGGVTPKHALLEIAAIATQGLDGEILGRYHGLVQPDPNLMLDDIAAQKNGYTRQGWIHAQHEHVSVAGFSKWLRQFCVSENGLLGPKDVLNVAGYSVHFDLRQLGHAAARISDGWLHELLRTAESHDVMNMHKVAISRGDSKKLTAVCADKGIDFWGPAHGAEPDICATRRLHLKLAGVRT